MVPALEEIAAELVDAAFQLHFNLGPGLRESVYEMLLADELERRGLRVERQKPVAFEFGGRSFDPGFLADLVVNDLIVVELKSVDRFAPVHVKQLVTYLRLMGLPLGFLINFGSASFKQGIKRVANTSPRIS